MTQTQPAAVTADARVMRRRQERLMWARIVIFSEAALMVLIAANYAANISVKDLGSILAAALAIGSVPVLLWGAVRMGRDAPQDRVAQRVPWDWSDVVIFFPGAFAAAQLLESLSVPLAGIGLNGADATVRTAVESFVGSAAFYTGALLNVYVLVSLRREGTLFDVGWRRFKWWWIPVAVVAAYVTMYVAGYLQQFSQNLLPNQVNGQCIAVRHEFGHFLILAIIVVCVMAPLAEETIFRGFVYGWLRRWSPVVVAIPISGVIFAVVHQELLLMLPLFAVGCILAAMYQYSRSLWPGAIVHALFNLPGIIDILNSTSCR